MLDIMCFYASYAKGASQTNVCAEGAPGSMYISTLSFEKS